MEFIIAGIIFITLSVIGITLLLIIYKRNSKKKLDEFQMHLTIRIINDYFNRELSNHYRVLDSEPANLIIEQQVMDFCRLLGRELSFTHWFTDIAITPDFSSILDCDGLDLVINFYSGNKQVGLVTLKANQIDNFINSCDILVRQRALNFKSVATAINTGKHNLSNSLEEANLIKMKWSTNK